MTDAHDVLVLGEVLVELSTSGELADGQQLQLGFSGDALNAAAAAAAAGARVALLAKIGDDELGDALVARVDALGIDTCLLRRVPAAQGIYFVSSDPHGQREFVYVRRGSAGSTLSPDDLEGSGIDTAGVVVLSGITGALSETAAATVLAAAQAARTLVYDPNFRPRLTSAAAAADLLRRVAPFAALVTPACPGETGPLLGTDDPHAASVACRRWGAAAALVTRGAAGLLVDDGGLPVHVPALPPPRLVDQTGAGDCLVGTVAARLALGDDLLTAVRLGGAAASLSLAGQGGTGSVPSLEATRAHLEHWSADPAPSLRSAEVDSSCACTPSREGTR